MTLILKDMKAEIFADFEEALEADVNLKIDKKVQIVIDYAIPEFLSPVPEDTIRVFATIQPEGHYNHLIRGNPKAWTYLITNLEDLLTLENAYFANMCTAFVKPDPNIKKKFAVSTVIGGRKGLPGHEIRHELWRRRKEIKIPTDFYLGSRTFWDEADYHGELILDRDKGDKIRCFDCMFHIAIDSFQLPNMFSEKLIDPLITKTIPIYWGCTNIDKYFDEVGILQANSIDDIISHCNYDGLLSLYEAFRHCINNNYQEALKYVNYGKQLQTKIQEILDVNS